jgi:hypothetical protein
MLSVLVAGLAGMALASGGTVLGAVAAVVLLAGVAVIAWDARRNGT